MNPTLKDQKEEKLGSQSALITAKAEGTLGGARKWLFYTPNSVEPLIGFVHANSKAEALDRLAVFWTIRVIAVEADAPLIGEPMTAEKVAKDYGFFGTIIPAYSEPHPRTAYFYRQQAIAWAREARACQAWPILPRPAAVRLAKAYLASYRLAKALAV